MRQDIAVQKVTESLKKDPSIVSIFLKGSMGRGEYDEHSDIDLYVLVGEDEEQAFLKRRKDHLLAYQDFIYYEDTFIIAPQIIAVYEDWLHIDLFTVTRETLQKKDYFKVLHDPDGWMKPYEATQNLILSAHDLNEHVTDVAWFLFQYKKAMERGNDLWGVEMLRYVVKALAGIMLYQYARERSSLGLKAVHEHLPQPHRGRMEVVYEWLTPSRHRKAVREIALILYEEKGWMMEVVEEEMKRLLERMIEFFMDRSGFK